MIDPQAVRVEAARMTAQVLAGSGADIKTVLTMMWSFEEFILRGRPVAPANNVVTMKATNEGGNA